jgi:hypothetical protein
MESHRRNACGEVEDEPFACERTGSPAEATAECAAEGMMRQPDYLFFGWRSVL